MYWYASVKIVNKEEGIEWRDNVCVGSIHECFPICDFHCAIKEKWGENVTIYIESIVQISEADFCRITEETTRVTKDRVAIKVIDRKVGSNQ